MIKEAVSFYTSDRLRRKLDAAAKELSCSRNEIIESLLDFFGTETYERCIKHKRIEDAVKEKS